jgi:hypothetical protein
LSTSLKKNQQKITFKGGTEMPIKVLNGHKFDARPDRIDYRDRVYRPALESLPPQYPDPALIEKYLPDYTNKHKLILDQGQEGACTGFGLAAVINYLLWKRQRESTPQPKGKATKSTALKTVSKRMLYHMAKIYDEWPGEDYEGSSCRGAMKGWHRHGVCTDDLWPYRDKKSEEIRFIPPMKGWQQDAAQRPLGAYYRINKDSIADMQAAINEVGAIYVSAMVHTGWFLKKQKKLSMIPFKEGDIGGHAFAITGYTTEGFIVQNSWGKDWGYLGFAILGYDDWVQHGTDAWVAVLGAPMTVRDAIRTRSSMTLGDVAAGKAEWFWRSECVTKPFEYKNPAVQPLSESRAYEHTVVLENNGRPLNRFLDVENAKAAVREASYDLPLQWFKAQKNKPLRLAIYAHGGLNSEEASVKRIRVMAPYFLENGIYPLFVTWRTGFGESITGMLEDAVGRFFAAPPEEPARGWATEIKRRVAEAKDRSIEVACEQLLVKPIWMQMKQNAAASAENGAGLSLISDHLLELQKKLPKLEIHLMGHSAGSILHGYLLNTLADRQMTAKTCSLFAPACTVKFALDHYVPAIDNGVLSWAGLYVDLLNDEREQADTVGPYGKSLLYLVSRALEDVHKMPLLGMQAAWDKKAESDDMWNKRTQDHVKQWRAQVKKGKPGYRTHDDKRATIWDGQENIRLAHGSFDNDIEVVSKALERIIDRKLPTEIENLHGF